MNKTMFSFSSAKILPEKSVFVRYENNSVLITINDINYEIYVQELKNVVDAIKKKGSYTSLLSEKNKSYSQVYVIYNKKTCCSRTFETTDYKCYNCRQEINCLCGLHHLCVCNLSFGILKYDISFEYITGHSINNDIVLYKRKIPTIVVCNGKVNINGIISDEFENILKNM